MIRSILGGLKALLRKDQRGAELDEELQSYLEAATQDKMRRGMSYDEAHRGSRLEMGSLESIKEEVRSSTWESAVDSLGRDIRYGLRQLRRSPGFTLVAVLTIALGIAVNTSVFTLVHAVLLKPLPVADPGNLYRVGEGFTYCCVWGGLQDSWGTFDYPFYRRMSENNSAFDQLAAFSASSVSFSVRRPDSSSAAETINSEYVSGNYFTTLGLQPGAGRLLAPTDDLPEAPAVAVIGHRRWQQHYGGDPALIGSVVLVNQLPVTIVGVAPPGFESARLSSDPPELWVPLHQQPTFEGKGRQSLLYSSGMAWLFVMGRPKPGMDPRQIQSRLSLELQSWLRAEGRRDDGQHKIDNQQIVLTPGGTGVSPFRGESRTGLYLLSVAAGLVLLIACANLANLLLARGAARNHQTVLRLSLGATRLRLIRAALTESVILSLAGGAAGLLLAHTATSAILLIAFRGGTYVPISPSPSLPVFCFAVLLSVLTGVGFGAAPAWVGTRVKLSEGLRASGRSAAGNSSRSQRIFVVVQAALSVVLLAVAGLVTGSLRNLEKVDLGFDTRGKLLGILNFKAAGYKPEDLPQVYRLLLDQLRGIPGVRSASLSLNSPQNLCCVNLNISIGGRTEKWIESTNVIINRVSPRYFETIGTPVLRGRAIGDHDTLDSPLVAVVDQSFANTFFAGQDPIGKRFGLSLPGHGSDFEIVGVVKDAKYRSPSATQHPAFFLPLTQTIHYGLSGYDRLETSMRYANSIQLSVAGDPESFERPLIRALAGINQSLSVQSLRSYREQVAVQFNQQRLIASLLTVFSLLALLLASVGLYGVTAYNVARRTSEIGLRMALGASRPAVLKLILQGALLQVGLGLCIGVPLSLLAGHLLASQLYGIGRFDPFVVGGASATLLLCALLAGILPARRAASTDPTVALRSE
jgi:predicted permease